MSSRLQIGAAALLCAGIVCGPSPFAADAPRLLDPLSGRTVSLQPSGRAVHLVFFATWCPPCIQELGSLAELEERWGGDQGYRLVLVAVSTRHTADRLAAFVNESHPPGQLLFDVDGAAQKAWSGDNLPTHVVLDATGREVARAGELNDTVRDAIAVLLEVPQRGRTR